MSQSVVRAVREDNVLSALKSKLEVNYGHSPSYTSNPPPCAVDAYLLRYLRHCGLNTHKTIEKLKQRREFEYSLPSVAITAHVVSALRSGMFTVIGEDILHRPILQIRMRVYRTPQESAETDRLLLVLLHYMECLTMRHFSTSDGAGDGSAVESPAGAQNQEFIILMNDIDVGPQVNNANGGGIFAHRRAQFISKLSALASKYYPRLLGSILLVNVSWAEKQGIRVVSRRGGDSDASGVDDSVVTTVSVEQLTRYIDPNVLPGELGGRKLKTSVKSSRNRTSIETSNSTDFAQLLLRHWFTTTSFISQEVGNASPMRPLWQPLPIILHANQLLSQQAATATNMLMNSSGFNYSALSESMVLRLNRSRTGSKPVRGSSFVDDDGVCSAISDENMSLSHNPEGNNQQSSGIGGAAPEELAAERRRREQAEDELSKLMLGITMDESSLSKLEAALRVSHRELNVLISEVVQKAKAQHSALLGGGGGATAGPTLMQLLQQTDEAILQSIQERPAVPAMGGAKEISNKRTKRRCCIM